MKKYLIVTFLLIPLLVSAKSGMWFSFKTGFPITGSSMGLKIGPLAPYGGIDIVYIGVSFDDQSTEWYRPYNWYDDTYGNWYKYYESNYTFDGSATLFMPHAGLRFYLIQQSLNLYVKGDLTMVFPSVDGKFKEETIWYDQNGDIEDIDKTEDKLSDQDKKDIKDALNYLIIAPGIGVEYPFSDHFSIGGEFGFRLLKNSSESSSKSEEEDWKDSWQTKVSTTLGISYTSITLNYIL